MLFRSFWFRESTQIVIEGNFHGLEGAKAIGTSGNHSNFVVETFHGTIGDFSFGAEPIRKGTEHISSCSKTFLVAFQLRSAMPSARPAKSAKGARRYLNNMMVNSTWFRSRSEFWSIRASRKLDRVASIGGSMDGIATCRPEPRSVKTAAETGGDESFPSTTEAPLTRVLGREARLHKIGRAHV